MSETANNYSQPFDEDQVQIPSNFRTSYRFNTGKIQTGSEEKGTLREKERLVGIYKAHTIRDYHPKAGDKGDPAQHLTLTMITAREGEIDVEVWLSDSETHEFDSPGGAAIGFAWGILQIKPGDQIAITCELGREKNKWKKYPTFINFHHVDATGIATRVAKRPKDERDIRDYWLEDLKPQILAHPGFIKHEPKIDPLTHLGSLIKLAEEKGWPTPQDAPDKWLRLTSAANNLTSVPATLRDMDDDYWGVIVQALKDRDPANMPKALSDTPPVID